MPQSHFDMAEAHPLRRRRGHLAVTSRVGAIAATAVVHLVVIAAIVLGLQRTRYEDDYIWVALVPQRPVVKEPPPSLPLAPVRVINAFEPAAPQINVAPAPVMAAPPMMLPSPPSANPQASNAGPTWETALLTRLAGAKRPQAQHGVVLLRLTMNRDGRVLTAGIEKSSGTPALDQEALAALGRAQPLPPPPAEVPGDPLDLIVPVDFF